MNIRSKLTALFAGVCMVSSAYLPAYAAEADNKQFETYLKDYVVAAAESDYTLMHQYFENPAAYGIDEKKCDVTLGTVLPDKEDKALQKELSERLEKIDPKKLSSDYQQMYAQLEWEFDLSERLTQSKFLYLKNIWSSLSGLPQNLVTFFSEYELRQEKDIQPLITLINDVPRAAKDAIDYTKKQADKKTLMFDYDTTAKFCRNVVDTKKNSAVTAELMKDIDGLKLSKEKTAQYKKQVTEALNKSFFPAFQTIQDELKPLSKKTRKVTGLTALPDGKEYYEVLAEQATGTIDTPDEICANLQEAILDLADEHDESVRIDKLKTSFTSVEDIMKFLNRNYKKDFPDVGEMKYELQALADEQSQEGVVAYFLIPAVDSTATYKIRYNKRDYGDDPEALSLYDTMAHEGIPGHMYQAQYNRKNLKQPAQYLFDCLGFTEGYAVYASTKALAWLDLTDKEREAYIADDLMQNYTIVLLDYKINYEGMSQKEFIDIFGEPNLPLYNQIADNPTAFLSYYYGYLQIDQLEAKAMKKLGKNYKNADFVNALLKAGNVNFEIIKDNVDAYISRAAKKA